jgi:hypothetical protein
MTLLEPERKAWRALWDDGVEKLLRSDSVC